jgi:hypothetical protein
VHYKPPAQLKNPDYEDHGGGLHGGFMSHHVTCVYELCTVEPGTGGFVSVCILGMLPVRVRAQGSLLAPLCFYCRGAAQALTNRAATQS